MDKKKGMGNRKVTDGDVRIQERMFHYEFWSDKDNVTIKIFHHGKKGKLTEFIRHDKVNLKQEMTNALIDDGVIRKEGSDI